MLNILKKIGKMIWKMIKTAFSSGNILTNIASGISTAAGIALSWIQIRKAFKKTSTKANKTVVESVEENKSDIKDCVTDIVNRDQEIDQDIRYHGYTKSEVNNDPGVARALEEFRKTHGIEESNSRRKGVSGERYVRQNPHDPFFVYSKDGSCIEFYHEVTDKQDYEFCAKLYRRLRKMGWIHGPWNANPHKKEIERIYGP